MRSWRKVLSCVCVLVPALFAGWAAPSLSQAKITVTIGGTGTAIGVMKALGAEYERKHPDVRIEVLPSMGTPGAVKAALDGAIGLAVAGRALNDEERSAGAFAVEIARTPFIFVTHHTVGADGITSHELEDLYAGKKETWPNGERVRLILRPARETSSLILKTISPGMELAVASALQREGMIFAATDQESADEVVKTPGSLGMSTLTQVVTEKRKLRILSLNDIVPSVKTLSLGQYPVYKALFLVTTPKTSAAAKRFADFVHSGEARAILEKSGNWTGPF